MSFFKRLVPVKAQMTLNLEKYSVENGQPFKGSAVLTASERFHVDQVRMEIRVNELWEDYGGNKGSGPGFSVKGVNVTMGGGRTQTVGQKSEHRNTLFSQDVPVSQAFDISEGEQKQFPFEVTIPLYQQSRFDGRVEYSLKAVACVKGRPDVTKDVTPSVVPSTTTTVIQKEVIKIPCQFCGSLYDFTSGVSKCPNCGAPIKR
jgi:hypothetical protein